MKVTSMSDFTNRLAMADEREWLATQYVLGELSAVEAEMFEVAMLDDADLCQLVAETSLLISGVHAASRKVRGSSPVVTIDADSKRSKNRTTWPVKSALAAALLFAASVALRSSNDSSESRLASADFDVLTSTEMSADADVVESELDVVSDETDPNCRLCSLDAPEWLMTAVELEQESATDDNDDSEVF